MKTFISISIVLTFVVINACTPDDDSKGVKSKESTFEVCAIHDLEVKPDADLKEFEAFVMNEIIPIYNRMQGQTMILAKGDRGIRTGEYSLIITFESLEDRNRIYPPSGEFVGDFGDDTVWDKFNSMVVGGIGSKHTDYVKVIH
jgi:hypothetical protein